VVGYECLKNLIRRWCARHAYVPGEQRRSRADQAQHEENPYPPSPKVLAAIKAAVDGRIAAYLKSNGGTPARKTGATASLRDG